MWTAEHRRAADRRGLRYPSDLTDVEWTLIAPLIPPAKHGGRKRSVDVREVLRRTRQRFPFIEMIYADGGYQGPKMAATVAKTGAWRIEIVKRNDVPRFEVLPKRWIVERTFAWISRNRRLGRDFERTSGPSSRSSASP